jgi:hypothetical protein
MENVRPGNFVIPQERRYSVRHGQGLTILVRSSERSRAMKRWIIVFVSLLGTACTAPSVPEGTTIDDDEKWKQIEEFREAVSNDP